MRNCGEQTHELDVYRLKLWLDVAERRVTVVVDGEAFVRPDVVPPEARDDVAEPLQQTLKLWDLCAGNRKKCVVSPLPVRIKPKVNIDRV